MATGTPAQAQIWGGWWGGWRSEPAPYASVIPQRRVASIIASEGYALSAPLRRQGDVILADGVDRQGQHMHFVIDAYDGEILRGRIASPPRPPGYVGNGEPPTPSQAHAAVLPNQSGPSGLGAALRSGFSPLLGEAQPGLEPAHGLAKPKPTAKPKQTAARMPAKPAAVPVAPKAPSEPEKVTAPAPTATQEPAAAASAREAKASAAAPATPLAPDATPVNAPALPAPAAVEAKAPTPDIGPAVKKVDPAPTAAIPAPALPAAAPNFTDESK